MRTMAQKWRSRWYWDCDEQAFRIGTHPSGLKRDLNVGRLDTFVEDRQGNPVIGFVKLVSASETGKYLRIEYSAGRPG